MTALPAKTSISDTYPNPSNATARAGFAQLWEALNETLEKPEIDLIAGTTTDVGGQSSRKLRFTGSGYSIVSFGTNYTGPVLIRVAGSGTIVQNATTLVCPGATNLTVFAGDVLMTWPKSTTSGIADGWQVVRIGYGPASTTVAGVVELATDSEAQAGTDATRCVTPDNLGATVLGIGQTWQNMSASRSLSTTYTNSTGRPILVSVAGTTSVNAFLKITINGSDVAYSSTGTTGNTASIAAALVPNGATYAVTISAGTLSATTWIELR